MLLFILLCVHVHVFFKQQALPAPNPQNVEVGQARRARHTDGFKINIRQSYLMMWPTLHLPAQRGKTAQTLSSSA